MVFAWEAYLFGVFHGHDQAVHQVQVWIALTPESSTHRATGSVHDLELATSRHSPRSRRVRDHLSDAFEHDQEVEPFPIFRQVAQVVDRCEAPRPKIVGVVEVRFADFGGGARDEGVWVDDRVRPLRVLDIDLGDLDLGPEPCHRRVLCGFWAPDAERDDCSVVSNTQREAVLVEAAVHHGTADLHFA